MINMNNKVIFSSLALAGVLALGACNNAANKIKEEEGDKSSQSEQSQASSQQNDAQQSDAQQQARQQQQQKMEQQMKEQREQQIKAQDVSSDGNPQFEFSKEKHDFGKIQEGTVAKHDFEFTNTGDAPLVITSAKGSCGCTVPSWPREPIAPGESGKIHVEFNSSDRTGNQTKQVTLTANTTPNKKILRINAQVQPQGGENQ